MRYLLDRRKTGAAHGPKHSRLSLSLVRQIRGWASREGYGLSRPEQIARLQEYYPVAAATLRQILNNTTWYDPTYEPGMPDESFFRGRSVLQLVVRAVQQWGAS